MKKKSVIKNSIFGSIGKTGLVRIQPADSGDGVYLTLIGAAVIDKTEYEIASDLETAVRDLLATPETNRTDIMLRLRSILERQDQFLIERANDVGVEFIGRLLTTDGMASDLDFPEDSPIFD